MRDLEVKKGVYTVKDLMVILQCKEWRARQIIRKFNQQVVEEGYEAIWGKGCIPIAVFEKGLKKERGKK